MIACLDVHYRDPLGIAAAVTFGDWPDADALGERVVQVPEVAPYESGRFYVRELPCLLAVLETLPPLETVVVDGYVWLDAPDKPGLGGHLFHALGERVAVVGIAKTRLHGAAGVQEVLRGTSQRPLFVSAAGLSAEIAAEHVRTMHGEHRIPRMLSKVDALCRRG
jgi:deoxyribonuclease V